MSFGLLEHILLLEGILAIVLIISALTISFIAYKRFTSGKFRYFVKWILIASAFMCASFAINIFLDLLYKVFEFSREYVYGPLGYWFYLSNFLRILTAACFLKGFFVLKEMTDIYGTDKVESFKKNR